MFDIIIPDFLLGDSKPTRLSKLIDEYEGKFGKDTWSTEGYDFDDEELETLFEQCLREERTFYDVIGDDPRELDEDEEI